MTQFRWRNSYADVQTYRHGRTVQAYFHDVVLPALATLQTKIDALDRREHPADAFVQDDLKLVRQETKRAFGLSIQSIWERQLREYLIACAQELSPSEGLAAKIVNCNWAELQRCFGRLRGIELAEFPSFSELDLLHHLGNACRHGGGASAAKLYARARDLWPDIAPLPDGFPPMEGPLAVSLMDIPVERLQSFVAAVDAFWSDVTYIYNTSIEPKHPSLEAWLAEARQTRTWFPKGEAGTKP